MNGGPRRIRRTISLFMQSLSKSLTSSIRIAYCCFEIGDSLRFLCFTRSRVPLWMKRKIYYR